MDDDILLAGTSLCLSRDGRQLLREVDIELPAGRIVTLIGPNGSGKTSLVRILLGLERPDSGQVRRTRPLRVGYMPQRVHIDPKLPLSVERFLRLSPQRRQNISQALQEAGIIHLRDSPLQKVSGGEFQRVLLARALLRDPELLVLDEPAQGLDLNGQAEFYELIERIRDRHHCAVLMISHDLHWVMATTDTVVCLNHHVCCHGRPEQVSNDPAYRALFGGRHAELIAPYQHDHDHHHSIHGEVIPERDER